MGARQLRSRIASAAASAALRSWRMGIANGSATNANNLIARVKQVCCSNEAQDLLWYAEPCRHGRLGTFARQPVMHRGSGVGWGQKGDRTACTTATRARLQIQSADRAAHGEEDEGSKRGHACAHATEPQLAGTQGEGAAVSGWVPHHLQDVSAPLLALRNCVRPFQHPGC